MQKSFSLGRIMIGSALAALFGATLPAASASDDDVVVECQHYVQLQRTQRMIAANADDGGTGAGCPGAEGPRWVRDDASHFRWCMAATQAQRDAESNARRSFLFACNRKREALKWPATDEESCRTFSAGLLCGQSPNKEGLARCNGDGNQIMEGVNRVRKDRSLLFDPVRDKGFDSSRFYYYFSHWVSFSCEIRPSVPPTTAYVLIGHTAPPVKGTDVLNDKNSSARVEPGPIKSDVLKRKRIDYYTK